MLPMCHRKARTWFERPRERKTNRQPAKGTVRDATSCKGGQANGKIEQICLSRRESLLFFLPTDPVMCVGPYIELFQNCLLKLFLESTVRLGTTMVGKSQGVQCLGLLLILVQLCCVFAQTQVLVLLEDLTIRNLHSEYFQGLIEDGFDLEFKVADSKGLRLREWDDWLYDKLIIFAPNTAGAQHLCCA